VHRHDLSDEAGHLTVIGYIRLPRDTMPKALRQPFGGGLVDVSDPDAGPFGGQSLADGLPDTGAAAGNQRDLAAEPPNLGTHIGTVAAPCMNCNSLADSASKPAGADNQDMSDETAVALGRRIRAVRLARGQSLSQVADGSDLTVSFLSRLERGQTGVTVEKLRRLAAFWGLEIVHLFDRNMGPRPLVTRAGHGAALQLSGSGPKQSARSESLIPKAGAALQATLYRTSAGTGRADPFAHPGEEFVIVLSGTVTYRAGEESFELAEGDSIWHPSTLPHGWTAGPAGAVTLHVNTPQVW
jgi:quercetin dioxygenase-like cupin family protein